MAARITYRAGYKYVLADTVIIPTAMKGFGTIAARFIHLGNDGRLTIIAGYAWDGPSGPCPDLPSLMRASLVHDVFYQLLRDGLLPQEARAIADDELGRISEEDGAGHILSGIVEEAVEHFGAAYAARQAETVYTAP
jgi:hypothetical protein